MGRVKSSLHTKTTNSKANGKTYSKSGAEFERRFKYRNFNNPFAALYLGSGYSNEKTGLGHNTKNLSQIVSTLGWWQETFTSFRLTIYKFTRGLVKGLFYRSKKNVFTVIIWHINTIYIQVTPVQSLWDWDQKKTVRSLI